MNNIKVNINAMQFSILITIKKEETVKNNKQSLPNYKKNYSSILPFWAVKTLWARSIAPYFKALSSVVKSA